MLFLEELILGPERILAEEEIGFADYSVSCGAGFR